MNKTEITLRDSDQLSCYRVYKELIKKSVVIFIEKITVKIRIKGRKIIFKRN